MTGSNKMLDSYRLPVREVVISMAQSHQDKRQPRNQKDMYY